MRRECIFILPGKEPGEDLIDPTKHMKEKSRIYSRTAAAILSVRGIWSPRHGGVPT